MRLRTAGTGGVLIVVGIVLALMAAAGTWRVDAAAHATRTAVVATRDVPALRQLGPGDVRLATVPAGAVPPGALVDLGQAAGRYVRFGLLAGQVVRQANLAVTAAGASQFDAQLAQSARGRPSMRAVTLAVPAQFGAVLPRAGDRVDLLAVLGRSSPPQVRVIASDVLVLDRLGSTGRPGGAAGSVAPQQQRLLVLAMPLRTAESMALAEAVGQVEVVLVPAGEAPSQDPGSGARTKASGAPAAAGVLPAAGAPPSSRPSRAAAARAGVRPDAAPAGAAARPAGTSGGGE